MMTNVCEYDEISHNAKSCFKSQGSIPYFRAARAALTVVYKTTCTVVNLSLPYLIGRSWRFTTNSQNPPEDISLTNGVDYSGFIHYSCLC